MRNKSNDMFKTFYFALGLSLLFIITACQGNEKIYKSSDVKEMTVVIENTDYKSEGILYGHEEVIGTIK